MSGAAYRSARREPARRRPGNTRADWRKLIQLALACAGDADGGAADEDARLRLMTLGRNTVRADARVFDAAGAATSDAANGMLKILRAFARPETPASMRQSLATVIGDLAQWLDAALDAMATEDFRTAHRNRPEVWN